MLKRSLFVRKRVYVSLIWKWGCEGIAKQRYITRLQLNGQLFKKGISYQSLFAASMEFHLISEGFLSDKFFANFFLKLFLGMVSESPCSKVGQRTASWIQWNLSFRYIHCTGQFTPKMKANAEPRLLSSLVWIDSGVVVSQHRLESFFIK